jgi:hypothetical protein
MQVFKYDDAISFRNGKNNIFYLNLYANKIIVPAAINYFLGVPYFKLNNTIFASYNNFIDYLKEILIEHGFRINKTTKIVLTPN